MTVPTDAALQPNGDTAVAGTFGLPRFLPNGRADTTFGVNGVAQTGFDGAALAVQPNGEFIVVGQSQSPTLSGEQFEVALVTKSGTLDPSFGKGGEVTTTFPSTTEGSAADTVLVEPNGDIQAGGAAFVPGNPAQRASGNAGCPGSVQPRWHARQLFRQRRPRSVPGHQRRDHRGLGIGRTRTDAQVTEFNADGTVDTAFSKPPFVFNTQHPGRESAAAIAVEPDRKIVVVGGSFAGTSVFGVARLTPSGSLDATFGTGGVLTTNFQGGDIAQAVAIQPNGDIVVAGDSDNNTAGAVDVALARYLGQGGTGHEIVPAGTGASGSARPGRACRRRTPAIGQPALCG